MAAVEPQTVVIIEAPPFPVPVFEPCLVLPASPPGLIENRQGSLEVIAGKELRARGGRGWEMIRYKMDCIHGCVLEARGFNVTLGAGGRAVRTYDDRRAAVKVLFKGSLAKPHAENPMDEIAAMQLIAARGGHPNILPITAALEDTTALYLITPYCDGGDLFDYVCMNGGLSEDERLESEHPEAVRARELPPLTRARPLFRQLAEALAFLQREDIAVVHRDMSLENVLAISVDPSAAGTMSSWVLQLVVHDGGSLFVMDFGMSVRLPPPPSADARALIAPQSQRGKAKYMSPEVFAEAPFDAKADIWALGVMLYTMLQYSQPYSRPHPSDARFHAIAVLHSDARFHAIAVLHPYARFHAIAVLHELERCVSRPLTRDALHLIQWCMVATPALRPTVAQILGHPWLTRQ
ncbi:kinase-like domain-containing protein [Tribonema minus]|uniref:Kinase-like domain-containing protein n=1 Tax=Tribonema minus TaxID=303371 RepID=A0A835YRG4_9STRA|nr:kinase-like domain-containing protein [Tribonema minus]